MRLQAPRTALLALSAGLLAACGSGGVQGAAPSPAQVAAVASPSPSLAPALPSPSPPPDVPIPTVSVAPKPAPPPVPIMAHAAMPLTFGLVAVNSPSTRGTVTVVPAMGSYRLSVMVTGLSPGAHSVHLHFGICPSAGVHILVLGTLFADSAGNGSMSAIVRATYVGDGRFLIVYLGPSAGPLAACANLAGH
jgi:hypothetical protein